MKLTQSPFLLNIECMLNNANNKIHTKHQTYSYLSLGKCTEWDMWEKVRHTTEVFPALVKLEVKALFFQKLFFFFKKEK